MRKKNLKNLLILCVATFLVLGLSRLRQAHSDQAQGVCEHVPDGGFELGIAEMEISRFPRYIENGKAPLSKPTRDSQMPLRGAYSLRLPGLRTGGYGVTLRTMPLVAGKPYTFSVWTRGNERANLTLEVYAGGKLHYSETFHPDTVKQKYSVTFNAASAPLFSENEVAHIVYLWIWSQSDLWLDDISIYGPYGVSGPIAPVSLLIEPEPYFAVYSTGQQAHFTVSGTGPNHGTLLYRIVDPVRKEVLASASMEPTAAGSAVWGKTIELHTERRGFFNVEVEERSPDGSLLDRQVRSYVVLHPHTMTPEEKKFFGVAMEEHGFRVKIDAFIDPEDLYGLASKMGAGSVRVFSLTMPDLLSQDGQRYDFYQSDQAVQLMKKYQIEPLVVLGSNVADRVPLWLRVDKPKGDSTVDLSNGIAVTQLKDAFKEKAGERYLDIVKYKDYLRQVFSHFKGRVKYYELWNEPGHKFGVNDFLRIARATREIQREIDPDARLVGYSSTTHADPGKGLNPDSLPSFIDSIAKSGGLSYVDVLSYHSEHAFGFMGKDFDPRNQETGFVERLHRILRREHRADMPIWDSERGILWKSTHTDRVDQHRGSKYWDEKQSRLDIMEVARQLPMIYAAARSQGVDRVFWFYLDGSLPSITRPETQMGFWDAQMEPLPHLAAYDAMTEILGGAEFDRLVEARDGTRLYLFDKDGSTLGVLYNWKGLQDTVTVSTSSLQQLEVFDVMGNSTGSNQIGSEGHSLSVDGWPQYLVIKGLHSRDLGVK